MCIEKVEENGKDILKGTIRMKITNECIKRIRDLAHRYKCWREYNDEMNMRKLVSERKSEERKSFPFAIGGIDMKIKLLQTEMSEHEDISKSLYDYAAMLERLKECRYHMIPHKHDTEIIDYILTGVKKNEQ